MILQDKAKALIVDTATIGEDGATAVSERLKEVLGEKYIKCKY